MRIFFFNHKAICKKVKKTANNAHILTLIPLVPILQTVAHLITPVNVKSANSPTQCPLCI